ncbi:MAG: hypothetical protein J2P29_11110 [Actinobacteria bacterium]|nr:hypothetical protein [Actinomycetota bacterium]
MIAPQSGPACPVDLHYLDPQPTSLDLAAIIRHGRRIRRRRRMSQAGAVLAACLATASVIAGARGFTLGMFANRSGQAAAVSSAPIDALVASDPPANGELTLISSWPRHWTTVAWATRHGEVCFASFRTPMQGATMGFECPGWSPAEVPGSGGAALSSLLPDMAPDDFDAQDRGSVFKFVGLTSPQAVRVVLTAFGKDFTASVVQVPVGADKTVGLFLARIRTSSNSFGIGDLTSETAYDQNGHVIARTSDPP